MQLSATWAEPALETLSPEDVDETGKETLASDVCVPASEPMARGHTRAAAATRRDAEEREVEPLVCRPVPMAGVAARVDALMHELAQRGQGRSAALGAVLDSIGPALPPAALQRIAHAAHLDGILADELGGPNDGKLLELANEMPVASGELGLPGPGQGELLFDPLLPPPPPGDPTPPGGPGGQIIGPELTVPVIVEFGVFAELSNVWVAQGVVEHDLPWTLTVVFGGLFAGQSTSVQVDGSFSHSMILPAGVYGQITAQAFDQSGEGSNIASYFIV